MSALLEAKARKAEDGSLALEGRVQSGDVCVEKAAVFRAGPDPSSNAVSCICTAQGAGPQ